MTILVITTGGTIGAVAHDKLQHPDRIQIMPAEGVDPVRDALQEKFRHIPTRYQAYEHRDSNFIDEPYRQKLAQIIGGAPEKDVLITHGTDTVLASAAFFFEKMKTDAALATKHILLTGAMMPLANGEESDGYLNLKFSLEQLQSAKLADGVYLVFCDFVQPEKREGWAPRLYHFAPGRFEKYYDPEDGRYSRIRTAGRMQV